MTREEQIEQASLSKKNNVHADPHPVPGVSDMFNNFFSRCFVAGAQWADEHPAWRSVEDELPQKYDDYIVATDGNVMEMAFYDLDGWHNDSKGIVTHWMPLPTPPVTQLKT